MKTKLTLFVTILAAALFGVGCAMIPEDPAVVAARQKSWNYWHILAPNKHLAARNIGTPDDTSYTRGYERGYRTVVLTWYQFKTPDGKMWRKVSLPFYNYAPDYDLHEADGFFGMFPKEPQ